MGNASDRPNFRSAAARLRQAQDVSRRLMEQAPIPVMVLSQDLRIVDANPAYLRAVSRHRDSLAGRPMFEAFPDSPHDPVPTGVQNLSNSFEEVLRSAGSNVMPLQRYDIQPEGRSWEVRYWNPINWPVPNEDGSVAALVHHVLDVTETVLQGRWNASVRTWSSGDLLARADAAIWNAKRIRAEMGRDLELTRLRSKRLTGTGRTRGS